MEAITITLNGREVSGQPGMTVLDLARESGVEIPTLCHDPHLDPIGACRICIVEDERSGALMASCVTPIAPGMVINTESPRVQERRKTIIKLMLASHPDSCLVCDKGNRCQLRKVASDIGVGLVEFQRIPQLATIEEVNPFIERDLSKCILCAKCIRACQELVGEGAIDYLGRGFVSKPATLGDLPLEKSECTFCGTCVALCPTGAIMEKDKVYTGTTTTTVHTVCPFCGCGCGVYLEVKDNRLVRVRPDADSSLSRSTLCVKGSYGCDFVHSPDRLSSPMVKVNGNFEAVSWEEALGVVADAFKRIKGTHGSSSLAVFGSSKCTNEENYLLQRFARCVLGTNNIDNGSRLYNAATHVGLWETVGTRGTTNSLDDLERSQVILVIGTDPTSSAPLVEYAIKRAVKRNGAKLLLIDPRQTKLVSWANLWLRPKVGTDVALINGMAKVIIGENMLDKECVAGKTTNLETLAKDLQECTPGYVEKITGIPSDDICHAARLFAKAGRASIVYGDGITQNINGVGSVAALANLALMTGNIGDGGGGIYALQMENNAQGACDMGTLPDFLPGYQSVEDAQARKIFEARWGCQLPVGVGLTALEALSGVEEGKMRGMYIVGENPAVSFPNSNLVRQALESLDFLVVQDMFLTETAKLAKVVLPVASFAEKEGTFTNFDGTVQRIKKALEPFGNSLPDWEVILRLATTMNSSMPYSSPQDVMNEIAGLVPLYQGVNYAKLDVKSYRLGKGQIASEKMKFSPVKYIPQPSPEDGYPLTLFVGTTLYQFGSGSRSLRASRLRKLLPEAFVELGKSDSRKLKVKDGDRVKVVSPTGEVAALVRISDTLNQGMVFMPAFFPEVQVNELFDIVLDPRMKITALKTCRVRLERIEGDG
ncbi:MAG: formate dehydrogenase subunit alpha [Dehalococcoidia bacterium]|nr:formate dehydrogenase subunit alpha [Dehalococcoidia bacterium]